MIYFVQVANQDGYVKIGWSNAPGRRLKSLDWGPYPVAVLGIMEGGRADEQALHAKFKENKVRGEWFHPTVELLDYVRVHATTKLEDVPTADDLVRVVAYVDPAVLEKMERLREGLGFPSLSRYVGYILIKASKNKAILTPNAKAT